MTYKIYEGLDHLHLLDTATTIAFDSETTGLKPTRGGLRLLQFGCKVSKTIVVIDCWDLVEKGWEQVKQFCDTPRFWVAHNAAVPVCNDAEVHSFKRGAVIPAVSS